MTTGWYGKVPARGDFVSHAIPPAQLRVWDGWLQRGLKHAASVFGEAGFEQRLRAFAPWRWLAWPSGQTGDLLAGVLVASSDRVGRSFPLLLQQGLTNDRLAKLGWGRIEAALTRLTQAAALAADTQRGADFELTLRGLGDVFDAAAAAAPARTPARNPRGALQLLAGSPGTASLWWTAPADDHAPVPLGDAWPPHPELLVDLLGVADPKPDSLLA